MLHADLHGSVQGTLSIHYISVANTPVAQLTVQSNVQLRTLHLQKYERQHSPKGDMNAPEDFMEIITVRHIIAAAMKFFKMPDIKAFAICF